MKQNTKLCSCDDCFPDIAGKIRKALMVTDEEANTLRELNLKLRLEDLRYREQKRADKLGCLHPNKRLECIDCGCKYDPSSGDG